MLCLTYDDHVSDHTHKLQDALNVSEKSLARVEAALCSALAFIESQEKMSAYQVRTDWDEVGVRSQEVMTWWRAHKAKDAARKKKELEQERHRQEIKDKVLLLESKPWAERSAKDLRFLAVYGAKKNK